MASLRGPRSAHRARWWLVIILVVMAVHGWLTLAMVDLMQARQADANPTITRMKATYVSELKLGTPPVAGQPHRKPASDRPATAAPAPATPVGQKAAAPAPTASAAVPESADAAIGTPASEAASAPTDTASQAVDVAASQPDDEAPLASAPPASPEASPAAEGPPFVWPAATRVSYKVSGYFRGEIHGQAHVEWVRQSDRYQVRVDATLGPGFAPLGSWSLISEGVITPQGLSPRRFEQVNRLLIKTSAPRRVTFEDEHVVLSSGERFKRTPDMQDAASQFIQLSYRFMMDPALSKPGNLVLLPLALPKKLETIAYDVIDAEELDTPMGKVPTFHVKPRKMSTEGGVLPVEIWFAPGLQYLPVRILVRSDEKTFMDLRMERAPEQSPGEGTALPPLPTS